MKILLDAVCYNTDKSYDWFAKEYHLDFKLLQMFSKYDHGGHKQPIVEMTPQQVFDLTDKIEIIIYKSKFPDVYDYEVLLYDGYIE